MIYIYFRVQNTSFKIGLHATEINLQIFMIQYFFKKSYILFKLRLKNHNWFYSKSMKINFFNILKLYKIVLIQNLLATYSDCQYGVSVTYGHAFVLYIYV